MKSKENKHRCGFQDFKFHPEKTIQDTLTIYVFEFFEAYEDSTNNEVYCPSGKYRVQIVKYYGTYFHDIGTCELIKDWDCAGNINNSFCNLLF